MIEICRDAANPEGWQEGQMVLRWITAGMGEAANQFPASTAISTFSLCATLDATIDDVTLAKKDAAA